MFFRWIVLKEPDDVVDDPLPLVPNEPADPLRRTFLDNDAAFKCGLIRIAMEPPLDLFQYLLTRHLCYLEYWISERPYVVPDIVLVPSTDPVLAKPYESDTR